MLASALASLAVLCALAAGQQQQQPFPSANAQQQPAFPTANGQQPAFPTANGQQQPFPTANSMGPIQNNPRPSAPDVSANNGQIQPQPSHQQSQPQQQSQQASQSIPASIFDDLPGFLGITFPGMGSAPAPTAMPTGAGLPTGAASLTGRTAATHSSTHSTSPSTDDNTDQEEDDPEIRRTSTTTSGASLSAGAPVFHNVVLAAAVNVLALFIFRML
ncbi:hypothetical protein GGI07_004926 [Coemansia sp. Benny D115]|nr:hypothetical protein GGI07_004926 [Coemansia sp. Benny D115]